MYTQGQTCMSALSHDAGGVRRAMTVTGGRAVTGEGGHAGPPLRFDVCAALLLQFDQGDDAGRDGLASGV